MTKSQLNLRTDSTVLEIFKDMADGRGISQTDLFSEMVNEHTQGHNLSFLQEKLNEAGVLIEQKNQIIKELEKKIGKPLPEYRKVTFRVTTSQFKNLTSLAHSLQLPKCDLMSEYFLKNSSLHVLENNSSIQIKHV